MNQSFYIYKIDGKQYQEWADEWSDIKAKFPNAILLSQTS